MKYTHEQAMAQQQAELLQWRKILTAEAYAKLCEIVEQHNRIRFASPYSVFRGQDFTEAVTAMLKSL